MLHLSYALGASNGNEELTIERVAVVAVLDHMDVLQGANGLLVPIFKLESCEINSIWGDDVQVCFVSTIFSIEKNIHDVALLSLKLDLYRSRFNVLLFYLWTNRRETKVYKRYILSSFHNSDICAVKGNIRWVDRERNCVSFGLFNGEAERFGLGFGDCKPTLNVVLVWEVDELVVVPYLQNSFRFSSARMRGDKAGFRAAHSVIQDLNIIISQSKDDFLHWALLENFYFLMMDLEKILDLYSFCLDKELLLRVLLIRSQKENEVIKVDHAFHIERVEH